MSRVDEAMRRAASGRGDMLPARNRPEAEALSREPFPREGRGGPFDESSILQRLDSRLTGKVVVDEQMPPVSREQYRRLAAVLHDAHESRQLRVIMVASAVSGEGKTLTAANLALTFSESYRKRVLLIDADLRRPTIDRLFQIASASGLTEGVADPKANLVVRQVSPRLAMLPAGRPSDDPIAVLTSPRMRQALAEARETFDWIILDTPPLVLLPDAHLLASIVDGAVMVVRAESTPHALIKRAIDAIGRARILGVVLNAASSSPAGEYPYVRQGGYEAPLART